MALDDADRHSLEEIERQLEREHPRLARSLRREPVRLPRLQLLPVAAAVLVLLVSFGWLALRTHSLVPLLLALLPTGATVAVVWWQRTEAAGDPGREAPPAVFRTPPPDGRLPPWWVT